MDFLNKKESKIALGVAVAVGVLGYAYYAFIHKSSTTSK